MTSDEEAVFGLGPKRMLSLVCLVCWGEGRGCEGALMDYVCANREEEPPHFFR